MTDASGSVAHRGALQLVRGDDAGDMSRASPGNDDRGLAPGSGDRAMAVPLGEEPPVCREGEQYGSVVIRRFVTRGGMGEVYEAYHPHMDQRVALKVLRKHYRDRPDFVERFRDEGRVLASICQKEPHVVQIRDVGFDPRCGPFITMEWLVGKNVSELIDAWGGSIPVAQAVHLAIRVADVTHRVHLLGLIHRDLKPANLFLERVPGGDPRLVLLDLGIAKRIGGARTTDENRTLGTIDYMAPEQITSGKATVQSDVYALGIILHEMLSGDHPFGPAAREALAGGGDDQRQLVMMGGHLYGSIPRLDGTVAPEARGPGGALLSLADIVSRATAREPEGRPATMEALALELRGWLAAHRSPSPRGAEPPIAGLREAVERDGGDGRDPSAFTATDRVEVPVPAPAPGPVRCPPIAPVEATAIVSGCSLRVAARGLETLRFPLLGAVTRIGREPSEVHVAIEHPTVSRVHCELRHVVPGVFQVVDLGSTHGLVLDGHPTHAGILRVGDQMRLGDVLLDLVGPGGWRRLPDGREVFVASAFDLPPAERATVKMVGDVRHPLGAMLDRERVLGPSLRRGDDARPSSRRPASGRRSGDARTRGGGLRVAVQWAALVALVIVGLLATLRLGMLARELHEERARPLETKEASP